MKEQEWKERIGADFDILGEGVRLDNVDTTGYEHTVIPDLVLVDADGVIVIVEYKHNNKLNNNGGRGGKVAAEREKGRQLASRVRNYETRKKMPVETSADHWNIKPYITDKQWQNVVSKYGWNHSIHKMRSMAEYRPIDPETGEQAPKRKVVIVDPKQNFHLADKDYLRMITRHMKYIEFLTPSSFEDKYQGCLQVLEKRVETREPAELEEIKVREGEYADSPKLEDELRKLWPELEQG